MEKNHFVCRICGFPFNGKNEKEVEDSHNRHNSHELMLGLTDNEDKKPVASEFIEVLLWHLLKNKQGKNFHLSDTIFIHLIGEIINENPAFQKLFTGFQIYFNLNNFPIDSREIEKILSNFYSATITLRIIPNDLITGRRRLTVFNGAKKFARICTYLKQFNLENTFEEFLSILQYRFDLMNFSNQKYIISKNNDEAV